MDILRTARPVIDPNKEDEEVAQIRSGWRSRAAKSKVHMADVFWCPFIAENESDEIEIGKFANWFIVDGRIRFGHNGL